VGDDLREREVDADRRPRRGHLDRAHDVDAAATTQRDRRPDRSAGVAVCWKYDINAWIAIPYLAA
jgi:hypothetical protein